MRLQLPWFGRKSAPKTRSFDEIVRRIDGGIGAGNIYVSNEMALRVATVMACAKVICDGVATPELGVFRKRKDGGSEEARDEPVYRLLNRRPNEMQTSFEFRRTMTLHAVLTGNALAIKVEAGGRLRELIPVAPGRYSIEKISRYDTIYRVSDEFGLVGNFTRDQVFHLPNWNWDWHKGLDAVQIAASAIGLAIAAESHQASLSANGGRPAGILSTSEPLSPDVIANLKESWRAFSEGNRFGTAVLDKGMTYTQMSMTSVDQQHLETRRFQVEEICRAFNVFPIMVGHSENNTSFASSEAFFSAHEKHTLAPWRQLWSQRLDESVLDGAGPLHVRFDNRYMLAGSVRDRAQWARTMTEMGIMTRNEMRQHEGLDPLPGLDEPLTPMNMDAGETPEGEGDDEGA